jgi:hypothetical protein
MDLKEKDGSLEEELLRSTLMMHEEEKHTNTTISPHDQVKLDSILLKLISV